MSSQPDHLYLDLSVINNDNTGGAIKNKLEFTEVRNQPFLENPDNYYLGISRFEIDTPAITLPIFTPILLLDGSNTNLNKTIYTITIAENILGTISNASYVNVLWSPEDQTAPLPKNQLTLDPSGNQIPNTPFTTQDITTGYYNCYTAKWWINCINNALNQLALVFNITPPFLTIDPNTNLISLYTEFDNVGGTNNFAEQSIGSNGFLVGAYTGFNIQQPFLNTGANYVMFFNEPLYNLLSGFNSVYYGANSLNIANLSFDTGSLALYQQYPYLFNYYIQPIDYQGVNDISLNGINYNILTSDYSPVPMWNPIAQMIFSSSLLPVAVSLTNTPAVYNSNNYDLNYTNSGNNANVNNMLTDIEVGLVSGSEYKPNVLYIPKNEYRLVDLLGSNPINQASFSISYKNKYGVVIPFKLGSQCGANIKLLFRRKRFNLNNLPPYDTN
jgi:hypothetical protein